MAEAVAATYVDLWRLYHAAGRFVIVTSERSREEYDTLREAFNEAQRQFIKTFYPNRIYFHTELADEVEKYQLMLEDIGVSFGLGCLNSGKEARESITK